MNKRILLTGASGQLGTYLIDEIQARGHELIAWSGATTGRRGGTEIRAVDLADPAGLSDHLNRADPALIIHAAAISAADAVRLERPRAERINVASTRLIADWCTRHDRRLVFTSTDLVFDGGREWNREEDEAAPILAYGQTKRDAERAVLACPSGLVARLPLMYGPSRCGRPYFYTRAIEAIGGGETQTFFEDEYRTPLDLATAARLLLAATLSPAIGILHVAGAERMSRYDLMRRAVIALGLDPSPVRANRRSDVNLVEPRPADVSLDTTRLAAMLPGMVRPSIEEALSAP